MTEEILDKNWKMKSLTEREFLETTVPGSVYQTYLAHGKMEDPFTGIMKKRRWSFEGGL